MPDEYDLEEIHKYTNFRCISKNPTKMNIIVPIIPELARNIMDLTLLVAGVSLNILLGLVIVLNSSMRTSANCYLMSLACSNLVILIEPLHQVLQWMLDTDFKMNLDYIFLMTFDTSSLMMILLNIETYVVICQKSSPLRASLLKVSTAAKGVSFIWIMCIMLTAMELHMYDHFEKEVMYDIYVSSTVMFLIFPCFIFIMLDFYILYDLMMSKLMDRKWSDEDVERFVLLVGITLEFLLTMIPYRVTRATTLVTSSCCNDLTIEIVYTIVKMHSISLPIMCFALSKKFRRALKITLCCECQTI